MELPKNSTLNIRAIGTKSPSRYCFLLADLKNQQDLHKKLGSSVIEAHNKSPYLLLSSVYPEYEWLPWKFGFNRSPRNWWDDVSNQRKYMDWVSKELHINKLSDWYNVSHKVFLSIKYYIYNSSKEFIRLGGSSILKKYPSLHQTLESVYPEYEWLPWKFEKSSKNIWDDIGTQKKFMESLGIEIGIKEMSDWYKLNSKVFIKLLFIYIWY